MQYLQFYCNNGKIFRFLKFSVSIFQNEYKNFFIISLFINELSKNFPIFDLELRGFIIVFGIFQQGQQD